MHSGLKYSFGSFPWKFAASGLNFEAELINSNNNIFTYLYFFLRSLSYIPDDILLISTTHFGA